MVRLPEAQHLRVLQNSTSLEVWLDLPGACGCSPALVIHYLHGLYPVLSGLPICKWPKAELFLLKAQKLPSQPLLVLAGFLWESTAAADDDADNYVGGGGSPGLHWVAGL